MTKMTITDQINAIAFDTLTEDQFNFLVERALKSVRKSTGERKPTKVQTENELLKADILVTLSTADEPLSIKAIQEATASLADLSNQRISHLLKALVDSGQVDKVYVKKTPLFSLASAD